MPIVQIIHKSLVIFLLLGGTFALVLGVGLLLRADWCMRLNEAMSRWISTREALRPLEVPRDTQRVLYRHHRVLGLLVSLSALYVLAVLIGFDVKSAAREMHRLGPPHLVEFYLRAGRTFLLLGNAAALLVGMALLLRPSLLRGLESWANRSYSFRPLGRFVEAMNYSPDRLVQTYPRASGALIAAGSLWIIASLAPALFPVR